MIRKALLSLLLLAALSGCRASKPQTPEATGAMSYGKWGFVFFTPYALPATVTRVMIIDSKDVVSSFRMLDSSQGDPGVIGQWNNRTSSGSINFNKARHPPVLMLFCWDSIIDKQTYETRIIFPASLRDTMLTSIGKDRYGKTTWYDTMLFGLAPEGKVRIWLQSRAGGDNVPLTPKKITTLSGDNLDACKEVPSRIDFNYSIPDGYDQNIKDFIKGKTYPYGEW